MKSKSEDSKNKIDEATYQYRSFLLVRRNLEKISQNLNALICTMTKDEVEEYYKRTKDEA